MWGLATIQMLRAYQDPSFLDDAISIWRNATKWMISKDEASIGYKQLTNSHFNPTCNNCEYSYLNPPNITQYDVPHSFSGWRYIQCAIHNQTAFSELTYETGSQCVTGVSYCSFDIMPTTQGYVVLPLSNTALTDFELKCLYSVCTRLT